MDGHKHEELSDGLLEREIEAALGVDPSPEFLPRVRARVASERIDRGWAWPGSWQWAGAALAMTVMAIVSLWMLRDQAPAPRENQIAVAPRVEPSRPATDVVRSPAPPPEQVAVPVARRTRTPQRLAHVQPEIVIAQDEAAALRQLFAAISNRRLEPSALPDLEAALKPPAPIEEIVLEPITISPLAPLEGE